MLKRLIGKEWLLTTVLVLVGSAICVRLGFWQLDRLEQRRNFNAHVEAMWAAAPLSLPDDIGLNLEEMEYRAVCIIGEYDYGNQIALRNQYWRDQFGYHLITPMMMSNGQAIMVDRGWIPATENDLQADWSIFNEPMNTSEVCGIIRLGRDKPDVGGRPDPTLSPGEEKLLVWNNVNLARLGEQVPNLISNVYIQVDENESDDMPPIPYQPEIELSEGPHLGYAGQWFTFAAILFFGYPFFVIRRENQND